MIEIIEGDLRLASEKYLCHQTNCVSNRSAHLAKTIFEAFPHADVYSTRTSPDTPGAISIRGDGVASRFVINMFGQYYPGSPKFPSSKLDGFEARRNYFRKALFEVSKVENLESIAFPFGIGCGAAGGDWKEYLEILNRFSDYVQNQQSCKIVLYHLVG